MKPEFWRFLPAPFRAATGDGAGAAGAGAGGAGAGGTGDGAAAGAAAAAGAGVAGGAQAAGAGDGAGAAGAGDPAQGAGAGTAKAWWQGDGISAQQRDQLTALGLTVDDPVVAVAKLTDMERAAKQKLGKSADQLMDRPGKDENVADWMKKNAALFGIPESPDKYDIKPPEGWPKDAEWNTELETKARALAHKHGLSGAAVQDFVNLEAENIMGLMTKAQNDLEVATAEMRATLVKEWGNQYAVKEAQAKAAAQVVAEAAGLDNTALEQIAGALSPKIGDANVIRMFAAIGEMMGDDKLTAFNGGGGSGALTTSPAEARAELNKLRAPGGEYFEATKGGKAASADLQRRIEHLSKLAVQGQKV